MSITDDELLAPARERAEIEWSVALSREAISTDRFVIYGMERPEMLRFLSLRGVDGERLFASLQEELGAPCQVAIGRDGRRTKAYWFLETPDPAFFGVDCEGPEPTGRKRYRLLEVEDVEQVLDSRLHDTVQWLLERPEFEGDRLLHLVALRRGDQEAYTGVHLGLNPDWRGLVSGDDRLMLRPLITDLLGRLGLSHHMAEVEEALLSSPMAWTCYVSVLVRPDGALGVNLYARANPVTWRGGGCWLTEPGRGGVVPRPVVLTFALRAEPEVAIRMRWHGDEPCFFESEGWRVEYRSDEADDALRSRGVFEALRTVVLDVTTAGGPDRPLACLDRLEARGDLLAPALGPDMRYSP
jgi:hypothetical protein